MSLDARLAQPAAGAPRIALGANLRGEPRLTVPTGDSGLFVPGQQLHATFPAPLSHRYHFSNQLGGGTKIVLVTKFVAGPQHPAGADVHTPPLHVEIGIGGGGVGDLTNDESAQMAASTSFAIDSLITNFAAL